jgi:hypothetical protein
MNEIGCAKSAFLLTSLGILCFTIVNGIVQQIYCLFVLESSKCVVPYSITNGGVLDFLMVLWMVQAFSLLFTYFLGFDAPTVAKRRVNLIHK